MAKLGTLDKLTPMMEQWQAQRSRLADDTLLLFRLGDFYEAFQKDAETAARVLGITLTARHGMPMAGIPYHAAETYINKLLNQGFKVAVCDQMEVPQAGKLVKRELTRILTPGTTLESAQLREDRHHFLLAVAPVQAGVAAAWLDLSAAHFEIAFQPHDQAHELLNLFASLDPREILLPFSFTEKVKARRAHHGFAEAFTTFCADRPVTRLDDLHFDPEPARASLLHAFGLLSLEGFGIPSDHPGLGPAGAIFHYATENLCSPPRNLRRLRLFHLEDTLQLDPSTLRNLEIFQASGGQRHGSLLQAVNGTVTAAGARLLERWMSAPRLDLDAIRARHAGVRGFLQEPSLTGELRARLRHCRDLIRILARLQNRIRNPRELGGIRETLLQLPAIALTLARFRSPEVRALSSGIHNFDTISELLSSSLQDDLPGKIEEGGVFRLGYDAELDRLRGLTLDSKTWLADLEAAEQARTGIRNLRIKYNGAFGYFIEVTKANLALVPPDYIRKQTMVGAERYTTEDLRRKEKEILHAEELALAREEELFRELLQKVLRHADTLQITAEALAMIDVLAGWSALAREWNYCEPEIDDSHDLVINQGRHPVVEQMMKEDRLGLAGTHAFVPNDTVLSSGEEQIALITGPNMAGKSTYIRQVALIALLAHIGCWVPAARCRVGRIDRIFSRVGASDELSRGHSTFMVEMNETANILNHAGPRSLIILDEIGRGTSTYDGISIAWAVAEHLHGPGSLGPRTLFATHYHELTQLAELLPRVRNYTVAVKEWNEEIIFVRQVVPGAADRSYGIHVARLAGLPEEVISRARFILQKLEGDDLSHNLLRKRLRRKQAERRGETASPATEVAAFDDQLELF